MLLVPGQGVEVLEEGYLCRSSGPGEGSVICFYLIRPGFHKEDGLFLPGMFLIFPLFRGSGWSLRKRGLGMVPATRKVLEKGVGSDSFFLGPHHEFVPSHFFFIDVVHVGPGVP